MEPRKKTKGSLRGFFDGNSNAVKILLVVLAVGVAVLVLPPLFMNQDGQVVTVGNDRAVQGYTVLPALALSAEAQRGGTLECRLSEILSLVEGAGRVEVLVHYSRGYERVFAKNTTLDESNLTEHDAAGGTRNQSQMRESSNIVTLNRREGGDEPLILYEIAPRIEGVLIVAEGGGNIFVRDALTRAASGLLGVAIHNITVLPMAVPDSHYLAANQ